MLTSATVTSRTKRRRIVSLAPPKVASLKALRRTGASFRKWNDLVAERKQSRFG